MKHLITGGSGFLGSLIASRLLEQGQEVICLDVWEAEDRHPDAEFHHGSVLDRDLVKKIMSGIDIVHHTAALVPLTKAGEDFERVNAEGSRLVAQEAASADVRCFVHTSSSAIFGKSQCPITAETPLAPIDVYARSKLRAEEAISEVSASTGLPLIVMRPRTLLGGGRLGIFQILFDWIKDGRDIYVIGDGSNIIQFLHALDLIDCYMFLLDKDKPGFYNIGSDRYETLETELTKLIEHAGTESRVRHLPKGLTVRTLEVLDVLKLSPLAPWHYLTYGEDFYFDLSPLTNLGWTPRYSNHEMLVECYDQFVEHYDEFKNATEGSAHRKVVKEKVLWLLKQIS